MRKTLVILVFSFCGFCDFTFIESGARNQGLGNATIGLSDNIYAVITNPGGLSLITSYQTSFSYTTDDDKYDFLGISLPEKINGNFGIALLRRKDTSLYVSYGRGIKIKNKPILSGFSIKLFKSNGIGMDFGILYPLMDNLRCGFVLKNFLRPDFGYGFGISTKVKDFLFTSDIKKGKKASFHFGIEKSLRAFFIRAGFDDKRLSLGLSRFFYGIGVDLSISPLSLSLSF